MGRKRRCLTTGLLVCLTLALSACASPIRQEAAIEGKSLILAGIEINADFGTGAFKSVPGNVYDLNLVILGNKNGSGGVRQTFWPQSFTTRSRWIAFAVDPGTYALGEIVEQGNNGTLTIRKERKTTRFDGALPHFEVGPNEAVYIGTFRAQLGTNFGNVFGQLGARLLRDARKTYALQTGLARTIASPYTNKGGTFRAVDLFVSNPNAFEKYSVIWSARPTDSDFDPEPEDEVEGGRKRSKEIAE